MTLIKQIFADLSNCKSTKYNQWSSVRHLRAILYFGTLSSIILYRAFKSLKSLQRVLLAQLTLILQELCQEDQEQDERYS